MLSHLGLISETADPFYFSARPVPLPFDPSRCIPSQTSSKSQNQCTSVSWGLSRQKMTFRCLPRGAVKGVRGGQGAGDGTGVGERGDKKKGQKEVGEEGIGRKRGRERADMKESREGKGWGWGVMRNTHRGDRTFILSILICYVPPPPPPHRPTKSIGN